MTLDKLEEIAFHMWKNGADPKSEPMVVLNNVSYDAFRKDTAEKISMYVSVPAMKKFEKFSHCSVRLGPAVFTIIPGEGKLKPLISVESYNKGFVEYIQYKDLEDNVKILIL